MTAIPVTGQLIHIAGVLCPGLPGHVAANGSLEAWDCGSNYPGFPYNPPLPRGPECVDSHDNFDFVYSRGSVDKNRLIFPTGSGIRVGGDGEPRFFVVTFHYVRLNESSDGTGAGAGLELKLVPDQNHNIEPVYSLSLSANGFVGRSSVGNITASWTLREDREVTLRVLDIHAHDLITDAVVQLQRVDSQIIDLVRQNLHTNWGRKILPDSQDYVMRIGDRIRLTCVYNNTLPTILKIR